MTQFYTPWTLQKAVRLFFSRFSGSIKVEQWLKIREVDGLVHSNTNKKLFFKQLLARASWANLIKSNLPCSTPASHPKYWQRPSSLFELKITASLPDRPPHTHTRARVHTHTYTTIIKNTWGYGKYFSEGLPCKI